MCFCDASGATGLIVLPVQVCLSGPRRDASGAVRNAICLTKAPLRRPARTIPPLPFQFCPVGGTTNISLFRQAIGRASTAPARPERL